ncbi:TonB-dependent receptor [Bacteroides sp. 519]|uniref:SusC/RagA family TonB-linked outer membrane protein n=1 Tax=Bacteroides sp. 519 TaxID=2302937 RepID=UPI0013D72578|nr:TonB-dependent receptor [Bacteroides sp. 519]NDV60740.1 TonB-dependent receptor [Bacteroides sp. 519]
MNNVNLKRIFFCKSSKKNKPITSLLAFIILFVFATELRAQENSTITLSVINEDLQTVLDKIEASTAYKFTYRDVDLISNKDITISVKDIAIEDFLNQILPAKYLTFKRNRNTFSLIPQPPQENIRIKGNVVDNSGDPLIGVSVVIKGTSTGSLTDMNGNFSIETSPGDMLAFSYIGYTTQERKVDKNATLHIILEDDVKLLDEVVVVGYGTLRKGELTSSVASVKRESFAQGSVQDAAQLIQGKVAGLGVILPNGDPTSTTQIMLRGAGTLLSSTSPLVIIDGVPGDLSTVAPEDIESVDVLKDGSAAAIYGTRGNNGVIFVTTKKTRGDRKGVEIQSYITVQTIKKKLDMMNAAQYREAVAQNKPGAIDYGYDIDWLDEILRTPVTSVTNASFYGGNSETNYIANINYKAAEGIVKRSDNNVLTTRLEANHSMWDNLLKFNFNIMGRQQEYQSLGDGNSFNGNIYRTALIGNPTDRLKDDNGTWVEHTTMNGYMNPVAAIYESDGRNKNTQIKTFGSVTLTPIEQLFMKALVSYTTFNESRGYYETKKHISTVKDKKNGFASRGTTRSTESLMELTAQYREQFAAHNITVLGGYSFQKNEYENYWMQNWDFPSDQFTYNNMEKGAALKRGEAPESSTKREDKLIGFFGRVNYSFNNKYLLSASIRHEGSSKFGDNHKWGNFPAFSAGWNLTEESFMKTLDWMNNLKIRAGFGITGTTPSTPYLSLSKLETGDNFYTENGWIPTLRPKSNSNPDLKWEKKEEWNLGIDYSLFNDRVRGSFDFYKRTTKDLLWNYMVPMPPFIENRMQANAGTLENKGFEAQIIFNPVRTKDFNWNTTINYSTNSNKMVSLSNDKFQVKSGYVDEGWTGEPIQQKTHRIFEGGKLGNFFGFKTVGVGDDGKWIIEDRHGNHKSIEDQDPEDRMIIGNGLPKHFLSWDNQITYKNFDLSITMRGAFGYDILNMPRMFYEVPINLTRGNLLADAYKPKYGKVLSDQQDLQYVSYFVEKGDFWKIDNITLGYNLMPESKYIRKIRVYATGSNLFTFTGYKGIDPEVNVHGLDPGCDVLGRYPSTRSFTFGAIFTF